MRTEKTRTEELLALGVFGRGSRVGDRIEMLLSRGREFSPRVSKARMAVSGVALLGCVIAGAILPKAVAFAQTRPAFDVASIKAHPGPIAYSADPTVRGSSVVATASTLLDLITAAYAVRYDQISGGPNWRSSDHYDIQAKAEGEGGLTKDRAMLMLQTLLAERFHLKIHHETSDTPVYELVVAKNGAKLKESSADAKGSSGVRGDAAGLHMEATRGTMESLARQLSVTAGRPVVDKTGLTGFYAFTLDWFPANRTPEPGSDVPSMFTAVQEQLGLRLEPAKGSIEMIVIDHAEKPDAN